MIDEFIRLAQVGYGPNSDPEERNQALDAINGMASDQEFPRLVIENYAQMQEPLIVKLMNTQMKNIIKFNGSNIPVELIQAYRDIVFNYQIHMNLNTNSDFINVLAQSRVSVVWRLYPDYWPSCWEDLFNLFNQQNDQKGLIKFMCEFGSYAESLTYENKQIYNRIKDTMRADHSDMQVTKYLIQSTATNSLDVFMALRMFLKWVSLDFVIDQESLTLIWNGINSEGTCPETLNIFETIIKRGMPDEKRVEVLNVLNPVVIVQNILDTGNVNAKKELALASLLNEAGYYALQYNQYEGYADLAILFLNSTVNDTVVSISPFFDKFVSLNPDFIGPVLEALVNRLSVFFETMPDIDSLDEAIIESLEHISQTCVKGNRELAFQYLSEVLQNVDLRENINTVLAILCLISRNFKNREFKDCIFSFVQTLFSFVSLEFPDDEPLMLGYYMFCQYFIAVCEIFESEPKSQVFMSLVRNTIAMIQDNNEKMHKALSNQLFTIVKRAGNSIAFDPQIIMDLVEYQDGDLMATSGILIQHMQGQQADFFQGCMIKLLEQLSNTPDTERLEYLNMILQFVRSMTYHKDSTHIAPVLTFLESVAEEACSSDRLLSNFIRTIYASLEHTGLQLIINLIAVDKGAESYRELSLAIKALLNSKELTDHTWAHDCIAALIPPNIQIYQAISPLAWQMTPLGDDTRQKVEMMQRFLEMIGVAIANPAEGLVDNELLMYIFEFISNSLMNQYDHPTVLAPMITFVRAAIHLDPGNMTNNFVGPTLSFLQTSKFEPESKEWTPVVDAVIELHFKMHVCTEGQLDDLIAQTLLSYYDVGEQEIREYMAKMGQTAHNEELQRNRRKFGKAFFNHISRYLKSEDK